MLSVDGTVAAKADDNNKAYAATDASQSTIKAKARNVFIGDL